ncbi:antirepressor protein Ant [Klebsiella pneumoniae]|uniref:phage antirepressor N-terminal domain-containing protein n=1 Tax=Klebsiella pneumoniae TaxID=573 RepID=UPI0007CBD561|nr:phage antirepressor N-terminal domain-containing protein [Klebsiella pneumoniae]SAX98102.1 antirepressor protein Ant [Klebsiella pneumoniae]
MTSIAILEAVNTSYVPFNGQQIITAMAAGIAYVAMKPVVENLGMSWSTQQTKLMKQLEKFNCVHMNMVAADGKLRKLLCLPLKKLNGWLFSINPEKVRADIRDKLIKYQEECFTVLHDYWTKGEVKNPRKKTTVDERTPLRDAVNMLVSKRHMMYPEAYAMIHQRFNVESIEDLEATQIPDAIEYVHRIALEGEFLGKQEALPAPKLDIHYPADWWDQFPLLQRERKIQKSTAAGGYQFPVRLLYGFEDESPSAISSLISKLAMQGYDVSAVKMEYLAHRHYAERMYQKLSRLLKSVARY